MFPVLWKSFWLPASVPCSTNQQGKHYWHQTKGEICFLCCGFVLSASRLRAVTQSIACSSPVILETQTTGVECHRSYFILVPNHVFFALCVLKNSFIHQHRNNMNLFKECDAKSAATQVFYFLSVAIQHRTPVWSYVNISLHKTLFGLVWYFRYF